MYICTSHNHYDYDSEIDGDKEVMVRDGAGKFNSEIIFYKLSDPPIKGKNISIDSTIFHFRQIENADIL